MMSNLKPRRYFHKRMSAYKFLELPLCLCRYLIHYLVLSMSSYALLGRLFNWLDVLSIMLSFPV